MMLTTLRSSATGAIVLQLPLEMLDSITFSPGSCATRRYSDSSLSPPPPSSMNTGTSLTPLMPPLAFMSSIQISAAALAGTPKTEAGPEVKVVMPSFSSAGFCCAKAPEAPSASAPANSIPRVLRFMRGVSCGRALVQALFILARVPVLPSTGDGLIIPVRHPIRLFVFH